MRRFGIALSLVIIAALLAAALFQRQLGMAVYERAAAQRVAAGTKDFGPGLTVGLCGTGSPMPGGDRAGPCNTVIADGRVFVVDMGEGGARQMAAMGIDMGKVEAVFLTHFHSDHIDGLGPLALLHWTAANASAPLSLHGPKGVEGVAEGFNAAYAPDHDYRVAHHGAAVVPPTGGGYTAQPFAVPTKPTVVYAKGGLTVTAFPVDHRPVAPSVGYRFDYRGRSAVFSGDTVQSASLERAARGADLLVHEALQPRLVAALTRTLDETGQRETAQITRDILTYHATPEQAAESAQRAGVRQLVLSHLVPPLPGSAFYPAFLGDAAERFDGPITVGEDGMTFNMLPDSDAIAQGD